MALAVLPWQEHQWSQLQQRVTEARLPHALLFTGPNGVGKNSFAERLVHSLFCSHTQEQKAACGECRNCHLLTVGTHPDLLTINPIGKSNSITVDQIREISQYLVLTKQMARYKAVVISAAERMNVNAANSLLKSLEEPSPDSILILIVEKQNKLLATVRSRCQRLEFPHPDRASALAWLNKTLDKKYDATLLLSLARGGPLAAVTLADAKAIAIRDNFFHDVVHLLQHKITPLTIAQTWLTHNIPQLLSWLQTWCVDMIKLQAMPDVTELYNPDLRRPLQAMADKVDSTALYRVYDCVLTAIRHSEGSANTQLLLEGLFLDLITYFPSGDTK